MCGYKKELSEKTTNLYLSSNVQLQSIARTRREKVMVFHLLGMGLSKMMEADKEDKKKQDVEKMSKKEFIKKWGELHVEGGHGFDSPINKPMGDHYDYLKKSNKFDKKHISDALKLSKEVFIKKYINYEIFTNDKYETTRVTIKEYEKLIKEGKANSLESIENRKHSCGKEWEFINKEKKNLKFYYPYIDL